MCLMLQFAPSVYAADQQGAKNWKISNLQMGHSVFSFKLSNVEKAQKALAVIKSEDDETINLEIPFDITSTQNEITVNMPMDQYLYTGNTYSVSIRDLEGNESSTYEYYMNSHYYNILWNAYPNCAEIENLSNSDINVSAIVGFDEYKIKLKAKEKKEISYPTQKIGNNIEIRYGDNYGCSNTYNKTVVNEYLSIPSIYVWKDSITGWYPSMEKDERLAVSVNGTTYYSEYGPLNKIVLDFVTYPTLSEDIEKVTVWVESKNGSKSELKEYEVRKCELKSCEYTSYSYITKTKGIIKENEYGHNITKVSTVIDGTQYSCDVNKDGSYSLTYPKQEMYDDIILNFQDEHGCAFSAENMIYNDLYKTDFSINVLLSKAYAVVNEGVRIAVKIGDQIYYSDFAAKKDSYVHATFPMQQIGQKVSVWYEKENSSQSPIYDIVLENREYNISADVKTTYISGTIKQLGDYKVYAEVGGVEYLCTTQKVKNTNEDDIDGIMNDLYQTYFSVNIPKQKIGTKVNIIIKDSDGYVYGKEYVVKNIKPELDVIKITSSTTRVEGTTDAKSKITLKIGKKKYTGKADEKGDFSIKIKPCKAGTKGSISVLCPNGYTNSENFKVVKSYGYAKLSNYIYKSSTKAKLTVYSGAKGDKVKINIGKKTYTKKINSSKKKQKITININKHTTGSKVKVNLYDKFGKKKGETDTDIVYYGDTIYIGMSEKNATLTTLGPPIRRNDWGTGSIQWVFDNGASTVYAYIKNGKVTDLQKINY